MPSNQNDIYIRILADLKDVKASLASLEKSSSDTAGKVGTTWEGISGSFAKLGLAISGVQQVFRTLTAPISSIIEASAGFETLETRLISLYGSAQKGKEVFEEFTLFAANTPFSLRGVVEAGAQLKAFGANARSLIDEMGDLAAFMGTTAVEAANSFGRAFAGGAGAADILRERGVLQLVKSFNGIKDLTKETLPEFRAALIRTLQDPAANIAGAAQRLSRTFNGAVSNMQDAFDRLKDAIGDRFRPALQEWVEATTRATDTIIKNVDKIVFAFNALGVALAGFAASAGVKLATSAVTRIADGLAKIGGAAGVLKAALGSVTLAVGAFASAFTVFFAENLRMLEKYFGAKDGVVRANKDMAESFEVFEARLAGLSLDRLDAERRTLIDQVLELEDRIRQAQRSGGDAGDAEGQLKELNARLDAIREEEARNRERKETAEADGRSNRAKARAIVSEYEAQEAGYAVYREFLAQRLSDLAKEGDATATARAELWIKIKELDKAEYERRKRQRKQDLQDQKDRQAEEIQAVQSLIAQSIQFRRGSRDDQLALLDSLEASYSDNADVLYQISLERNQLLDDAWREEQQNARQRLEEMKSLVFSVTKSMGDAMQSAWEGNLGQMRTALHQMLFTILDAIEAKVLAAKISAVADAIVLSFTNPALGIPAILSGLPALVGLEALFAGLRGSITALAEGSGPITRPTLALIGENVSRSGAEIVVPEKRFIDWAREAMPKMASQGPDTVSHSHLKALRKEIAGLRTQIAGLARATGKETGKAIGSYAKGSLA